MTNKLNIAVTRSKETVPPQFEGLVHSVLDGFAKKSPVLSKIAAAEPPSMLRKKGTDKYKIQIHDASVPKFNAWSNTRNEPETKTIHVWAASPPNPSTTEKEITDSLLRAALHNIVHTAVNGKQILKSEIKKIGAAKPLHDKELKTKMENMFKLKGSRINAIGNALRAFQKAVYDEKDLHDRRTQKKLHAHRKKHEAGEISPAINTVAIRHFKTLLTLPHTHTPHAFLEMRLMRNSKTPKTSKMFARLFKTLREHFKQL